MFKEKTTEFGKIGFEKNIISDIVADAIDEYEGRVWLGDAGSRRIFKNNGEESFVSMDWKDELDITVYVIIKFGTSISLVTENILSNIKKSLLEAFGDMPMSIKIIVTGVQVKEQIAKRHIEVEI